MSGYALKVLNDAKASLAMNISGTENDIAQMQTEIDGLRGNIDAANGAIAELDAAITELTPPSDPGEAQPA